MQNERKDVSIRENESTHSGIGSVKGEDRKIRSSKLIFTEILGNGNSRDFTSSEEIFFFSLFFSFLFQEFASTSRFGINLYILEEIRADINIIYENGEKI